VRGILNDTIRQSFTQRDIDALILFYRTKSGRTIIAESKSTIRPYVEELRTRKDVIGADSAHDAQVQAASIFHVFAEAAQSHEMAQFYGNDIDDDITARLPNAQRICNREVEPLETEIQAHIRELVADYSAKWKTLASP
jgi:hypothetical protein